VVVSYQYHPEALAELFAAAEWYECELPGLGAVFLEKIEEKITMILGMPHAAPPWPELATPMVVRRALVQQFPFALGYVLRDDVAMIVAVADLRRRPGYWLHRLESH
jgi:toxin ParE1/3/4